MRFFPLQLGEIPLGSQQEFIYQVFYDPIIYFLFYPGLFRAHPTSVDKSLFINYGVLRSVREHTQAGA